jgi:predicted lysophospholipase L1 biosynthesis ABC-type transport system permease subunit
MFLEVVSVSRFVFVVLNILIIVPGVRVAMILRQFIDHSSQRIALVLCPGALRGVILFYDGEKLCQIY